MEYKRLTQRGLALTGRTDRKALYYRLALLEDMIEDGLLIDVPMKDWDEAYFIAQDGGGKPYLLRTHHWEWVVFARICGKDYTAMDDSQLFENGEDVFPTKEEAEARLAELRGE